MKNIGIFLAYSPEQSIKSHGISRLLAFVLDGMLQNEGTNVTVATPAWFKESILEFMQEQNVDTKKVELLTTPGIPYLLRIRNFFNRSKNLNSVTSSAKANKSFVSRLTAFFTSSITKLIMKWVSTYSTWSFVLYGLFIIPIGFLLSPVILLGVALSLAYKISRKVCFKLYHKMTGRLNISSHFTRNKKLLALLVSYIPQKIQKRITLRGVYHEIRKRELARLIRLINNRPDISVWFVPTLFWPEIKAIKAKKVLAAPDVVFVDFPTSFYDANSLATYNKMAESIAIADHFICYSDYVKQKHLVQAFGVAPEKVSIIPHGAIDLSHNFFQNKIRKTTDIQRDQATQIMYAYQTKKLHNHPYLANYNLNKMNFIFYSSQLRPYKNFRTLIEAYEILLRERFVNVKLVVTGDITADPEIYNYIISKRLQFDIISLYDVSADVLAALNHLAVCAVNPTLFEGGFPFTFTEAYSVGTPSVMSSIPVVTAEIDDEALRERMLFDPYNIEDMVNKIEWAVKNREELCMLQKPLYQKFQERSWNLVAKEYINLLTDFTKQSCANN